VNRARPVARFRAPGNRPVERPVELEDAGPVAIALEGDAAIPQDENASDAIEVEVLLEVVARGAIAEVHLAERRRGRRQLFGMRAVRYRAHGEQPVDVAEGVYRHSPA